MDKDRLKALYTAFFALVLLSHLYLMPLWENHLGGGLDFCATYLTEGVLYGGQPYCNQAPLTYYLLLPIYLVFGSRLWIGLLLVKVALLYLIYLKCLRYCSLAGSKSRLFDSFLFVLVVYPLSFNHFEMLFSTLFFLLGFETQFLGDRGGKPLVAGVFYSLSFFVKYSVAYAVAGVFLIRAYEIILSKKPSQIRDLILMGAPFMALACILYLMHPSFITYSILGQISDPPIMLFDAVELLFFSFNVHAVSLIIYISLSMYLLSQPKIAQAHKPFVIVPLISLPLIVISMSRAWAFYHPPLYYGIQVAPLLIAASYMFKRLDLNLWAAFVVVVLVYPGVYGSTLLAVERHEFFKGGLNDLTYLVGSGLGSLPQPKLGLLFESGRDDVGYIDSYGAKSFFQRYGWDVGDAGGRYIYSGDEFVGAEDPYWAKKLRSLTNVTAPSHQAFETLSDKESEIAGELADGRYDVVLTTGMSWVVLQRIEKKLPNSTLSSYCGFMIPDFSQRGLGRSHMFILYANKSLCKPSIKAMADHYVSVFDEICSGSERAALVVKGVLERDGVILHKNCNSGAELTFDMINSLNIWDILLSGVLFLLFRHAVSHGFPRPRRSRRRRS